MSIALALLLAAAPAISKPVINEQLEHYTVRGRAAATLRESLNRNGPIGLDGKRYDGYTRWSLRWKYDYRRDADGICTLTTFDTLVDVRMTLPQWQPEAGTAHALRRNWAKYLQALRTHEEGHAEIGRAAAHAIDDLMEQLPPQPDCPTLERELQARGQRILQDYFRRDLDYDQHTGHGRTQGAVFP